MRERIPNLTGEPRGVEMKWTGKFPVFHLWKIFHGQRTFAGKEPFMLYIARFSTKLKV